MNKTERYVHFNKSGVVTARLEVVIRTDEAESFITDHASAVKKAFDTGIADVSDASYERFAAQDRAYRFRPYMLAVEYDSVRKKETVTLTVKITLSSGRRVMYSDTERHRLRAAKTGTLYMGVDMK